MYERRRVRLASLTGRVDWPPELLATSHYAMAQQCLACAGGTSSWAGRDASRSNAGDVGGGEDDVVVIGGQAGLATGFYVLRAGMAPGTDFVILDGGLGPTVLAGLPGDGRVHRPAAARGRLPHPGGARRAAGSLSWVAGTSRPCTP